METKTGMKMNDPALHEKFQALAAGASDAKEKAIVAAAEQAAICYYYDMMKAMVDRTFGGQDELDLPDQAPMRSAVTELNRICANNKKGYLFQGALTDPLALFAFASSIALPER